MNNIYKGNVDNTLILKYSKIHGENLGSNLSISQWIIEVSLFLWLYTYMYNLHKYIAFKGV